MITGDILDRHIYFEYFKIIAIVLIIIIIVSIFSILQFMMQENKSCDKQSFSDTENNHITVIIDAGHGGRDGGAVGKSGLLEKDINLAIAKKIGKLFEMTDIDVQFTRLTDVMLYKEGQEHRKKYYDLLNRVEFSKQFDNPVFVSIHQNIFPTEKYCGLQVYYSKNHPDSKILAQLIQEKTKENLQKDNTRAIKEAGKNIFLLKNIECPAVIVECGFLSNTEEEKMLADDEYQKKLAFVIFSSLVDYINEENERITNEV